MRAELAAEWTQKHVANVVANDHRRETFCLRVRDNLHLVSGHGLSVDYTWPLGGAQCGSALAHERLALVTGSDRVTLLELDGSSRWSFEHPAWGPSERGGTWFDAQGRPFAVVNADGAPDASAIVRLDIATGASLAELPIEAAPGVVVPLHHPDGWVGLEIVEAGDAAQALWVRADDSGQLELIDPGWDHTLLHDVAADGKHVLTGPYLRVGPLELRSFPSLELVREIPLPEPETVWENAAVLVGDWIVTRVLGRDARTVAIGPEGELETLDRESYWPIPAADSFLAVHPERLLRWTLEP